VAGPAETRSEESEAKAKKFAKQVKKSAMKAKKSAEESRGKGEEDGKAIEEKNCGDRKFKRKNGPVSRREAGRFLLANENTVSGCWREVIRRKRCWSNPAL